MGYNLIYLLPRMFRDMHAIHTGTRQSTGDPDVATCISPVLTCATTQPFMAHGPMLPELNPVQHRDPWGPAWWGQEICLRKRRTPFHKLMRPTMQTRHCRRTLYHAWCREEICLKSGTHPAMQTRQGGPFITHPGASDGGRRFA